MTGKGPNTAFYLSVRIGDINKTTLCRTSIVEAGTHLQLVEGTDLLGPSSVDGLVDGTHPNDLGFEWMAEGLAERLRKVLGL